MNQKSLLSLVLASVLLCLCLAGCAPGGGVKTPPQTETETGTDVDKTPTTPAAPSVEDVIPKETTKLTVYSQLANYSGEQIGWFGQIMKERFNVILNIIPTGEGVFATRMESGDLGDIILFGNDADEYIQAVDAGMLLDWNEDDLLKDYGPYIYEHMQPALSKNKDISGGKVYGFGHNVGSSPAAHEAFFYHPDIRWDLYEQLGYPEINTLEDYIPVLEQMIALEPLSDSGNKKYAVSLFKDWDGDMVMYVKSLGALYGYDEFGFTLYDTATQTVQPILDDGSMYLRALRFFNQLYQKGLLDPDSMTQTYSDACDAYKDGAAIFNQFTFLGRDLYNTPDNTSKGKGMYCWPAKDMKPLAYGLNVFGGNRIWAIGSKTQYPELCMAIINWLSTPEGVMTYNHGPQGVTWDYDDQGYAYLTDLGYKCKNDVDTLMENGYSGKWDDGTFKMNNTTWSLDSINPEGNGESYNHLFWKNYLSLDSTVAEQKWRDYTGYLSADDYLDDGRCSIAIGSRFSMEPRSDELNTTWSQVAECVRTYSWNAVYAKSDAEFDAIVAEFKVKAKEYGYDECVEFCRQQAARRKAAEDEALAAQKK